MNKEQMYQLQIRENERGCRLICGKNQRIKWGSYLVVETNRGIECGKVDFAATQMKKRKSLFCKKIIREATNEDIKKLHELPQLERDYFKTCQKNISKARIPIILRNAELIFDKKRMIVYFITDKSKKNKQKFNIHDLSGKLSQELRIKIELKEETIRNVAKVLGGIATCGRSLCCSSYLNEIKTVSTRLAKLQGISMNPKNLCGICGKLKCCLRYEKDNYCDNEECQKSNNK
jgi:cell fate regulator YaaT (PSP1 superfamily)